MKAIGFSGGYIVVDTPSAWKLYGLYTDAEKVILKTSSPTWWDAAVVKWGASPLPKPVEAPNLAKLKQKLLEG